MSVLRKEDDELPRIHRDIGLGLGVTIFGNIIICIMLKLRQIAQRCKTKSFWTRQRQLDVYHLDMRLQESGPPGALSDHLKVQEKVFVLDRILAWFHGLEIMVFQIINHIGKERMEG